jgi:hypothetical protein
VVTCHQNTSPILYWRFYVTITETTICFQLCTYLHTHHLFQHLNFILWHFYWVLGEVGLPFWITTPFKCAVEYIPWQHMEICSRQPKVCGWSWKNILQIINEEELFMCKMWLKTKVIRGKVKVELAWMKSYLSETSSYLFSLLWSFLYVCACAHTLAFLPVRCVIMCLLLVCMLYILSAYGSLPRRKCSVSRVLKLCRYVGPLALKVHAVFLLLNSPVIGLLPLQTVFLRWLYDV